MLRRALTLSATAIFLVTAVIPAIPAHAQLAANTRYTDAFAYLSARGAVQDGRPYDLINRAEALKVILSMQDRFRTRIEWYQTNMSSLPLFLDYRQSDWFAPYVEAGFEADILTGYPNRTFRPANPVKTEEAVAMLLRAYGERPQSGGVWYEGYVQLAVQKNIAYAGERMQIGRNLTRGQFFDLLYRLDTVQTQQLTAFVDTEPVPQEQQAQPIILQPSATPTRSVSAAADGDPAQYASNKAFAITIPRLGITDLSIIHPKDALTSPGLLSVLKDGVGHLFSYPGKDGKIMIYGHSSSYSWDVSKFSKIFRRVNELRAGDRVYVTYNGMLHIYEVTGQQTITPNDITPFRGKGEELILFTCWPPDSIKQRLIVRALPVSTVALR